MTLLFLLACDEVPEDSGTPEGCVASLPENTPESTITGYRFEPVQTTLPWSGEARAFNVNVWYPTDDPSSASATYIGTFADGDARVDSPYPADDCLRPLVLYSHGSQGWGGNNSPLLRTFVANGWIAAAPDHADNTLVDDSDEKPVTYPLIRAADVVATLGWFDGLDASDPLYGHVDTSRVVVLGHSYGAQTAWLLSNVGLNAAGMCPDACTAEEEAAFSSPVGDLRIVAVQPMAGSAGAELVDDSTWSGVSTPILYMTGTEDNDGTEAFTRAAEADVRWVELEGGCHESFTSTTLACDTLDKAVASPIVTAYSTAFAWWTVLGSEAPEVTGILDGSTVVSDVATLANSR